MPASPKFHNIFEKYGAEKFCFKSKPNSLEVPIAISE